MIITGKFIKFFLYVFLPWAFITLKLADWLPQEYRSVVAIVSIIGIVAMAIYVNVKNDQWVKEEMEKKGNDKLS